jgi:uncharacterized protein YfiM (DUF2279 family)
MLVVAALLAALSGVDSAKVARPPLRTSVFEAQAEPAPTPDAWLGADKFKHFAMSYAVTAFAFGGARSLFDDDVSLGLAIAAGSAAGLLKEFYDRSRGRPFSRRDLVWDAAGVALGFVMVRQTSWK